MNFKMMLLVLLFFMFESESLSDDTPTRMTYSDLFKEWKAEYDSLKSGPEPKDDVEQKNRMKELRKVYTYRFLQLAIEHSSSDSWLSCFMWIHLNGVTGPDFDAMMEFMGRHANALKKSNAARLQRILPEFIYYKSDRLSPVLSQIAQNHPSEGMRGAALYVLAARTKFHAERDGSKEGCKQAEILLQKVLDEYPDVHTGQGKNKDNAQKLLEQLQSPIAIGKTAPKMKGKDIDGGTFDLVDERGKVVVLSFSGHWCYHCRKMHPVEKELIKKYKREQVVVIEINSDKEEDLKNISQKIETDGLPWQHVIDGPRGPISKSWHITGWPTFYILDREHHIRRKALGNIGQKLIEYVDQIVNETPE
jgi:thiol-disulfide isomerase/thioredoxin